MNLEIYDIHPHVISADVTKYPRAPLGGHQSDWSRARPVSYTDMIAAQDEAGIQKAALVQASTCYGHDNSYVAEAVAAHPERFTGVFSCNILEPDAASAMERWMDKGLMGLRLFTTGSTMPGQQDWLDNEKTYPAWRMAEEKGVSLLIEATIAALLRVALSLQIR